jgi:hypothetical protein
MAKTVDPAIAARAAAVLVDAAKVDAAALVDAAKVDAAAVLQTAAEVKKGEM